MIIDFFQISITPWRYKQGEQLKLEIMMVANGKRYSEFKIIHPNDFESTLDIFFDEAKERIRRAVINDQKAQ